MDRMAVELDEILIGDLDPEIAEFIAMRLAWEYSLAYDRLVDDPLLTDEERQEKFALGRGDCAVRAMRAAAKRFGIPWEVQRLSCNGQHKLLLRIGRLILIQETMQTRFDAPEAAQYKVELARLHGTVRQLEFDFGDGRFRSQDWSGCHLAVLLHAAAGPKFTREHKKLGALMLGLPDSKYESWVRRIDLYEVAMYGRAGDTSASTSTPQDKLHQEDRVVVTPKRKNTKKDRA